MAAPSWISRGKGVTIRSGHGTYTEDLLPTSRVIPETTMMVSETFLKFA